MDFIYPSYCEHLSPENMLKTTEWAKLLEAASPMYGSKPRDKWGKTRCRWRLISTELVQDWNLPATLVQSFESNNIEYLSFLISAPVNILFFYGCFWRRREGANSSYETVIRNLKILKRKWCAIEQRQV